MHDFSQNAVSDDDRLSKRILREAKATLPAEIRACYRDVLNWIEAVLDSNRGYARPVAEFGFRRLPTYYPKGVLCASKVIVADECPSVPLNQFGLRDDDLPPPCDTGGFTLRDFYFVTHSSVDDESTHFHELVHVVQWQLLGDECFFHLYATGLLTAGYRSSPLERIAYDLQSRFDSNDTDFDVVTEIRQGLADLRLV